MMSTMRIMTVSTLPPKKPGNTAVDHTDQQADDRANKGHAQRNLSTVENTAEQVASHIVCPQRISFRN